MNPPKRLTDPSFVYVDAAHTCIAKTFRRIRAEQQKARALEAAQHKVLPIAKARP